MVELWVPKPLLGEKPSVSHPGTPTMEYYMSEKLLCTKVITLKFYIITAIVIQINMVSLTTDRIPILTH